MQTTRVILFSLCINLIFSACQQKHKTTSKEEPGPDKSTEEVIDEHTDGVYFDLSGYELIMDELDGIEKFYVGDDLYRLHSLLKFKKDERYQALENHLKETDEFPVFINVTAVETANGYIDFNTADPFCQYSITYWNKTNGDKLIGNTLKCCTMFCDSDISFVLYNPDTEMYTPQKTHEIINEIEAVRSQKPDNHTEDSGFDTEFILPKKGKNIRYCVDQQKCLDLMWQDDSFSVVK